MMRRSTFLAAAALASLFSFSLAKADTSSHLEKSEYFKQVSSILSFRRTAKINSFKTKEIVDLEIRMKKEAEEKAKKEVEERSRKAAEQSQVSSQSNNSGEVASYSERSTEKLYDLQTFMFNGVINWQGLKFTYYSQSVLPGGGLEIPGRHVNKDGYVSDGDGYIVLAGSAPKGTVYDTPFGYQGKIYDRGTVGNHLDVYIR